MADQQVHITFIGAGNVASQLALTLFEQGYKIAQVYSRSKAAATALAAKVNAAPISDLKKLDKGSYIYIIAVKDDAIESVAKQIKLDQQIVVHTSGSVPMAVLKGVSKNIGVLYPLQTFSKGKTVDLETTPICIEANTKKTAQQLTYFAKSFSGNVQAITSEQRKILHLAAVFACNFSNHLYVVADEILKKNRLSLSLLQPLIEETATKIRKASPAQMQTGPAIRGDKKTMEAHLKLIKDTDTKQLYKLMSKGIIKTTKK